MSDLIEKVSIRVGLPQDSDRVASSIGEDLTNDNRLALQDKLERYGRKNDRDYHIIFLEDEIVGYGMVIERLTPPVELDEKVRERIKDYACGTGLGVKVAYQKNGIGALMVREHLAWAKERNRPGFWMRSRKMGNWYERDFQFRKVGKIFRRGVYKTVLAKAL